MLRESLNKIIVLLTLLFFLVSCNYKERSGGSQLGGEIEIGDDHFAIQEMDLDSLNENIRKSKIKNLDQVIAIAAPEEESASDNYRYVVEKLQLTENEAIVIVTETGLADDSIASQKIKIKLNKQGDYWQVKQVSTSFQCQANKGHVDWGGDYCK